ncbi:MAG: GNAT family N-acetyltransferase [Bacteroidota bacterium]
MELRVLPHFKDSTSAGPSSSWKDFHAVLDSIYRGDPQFIHPLRSDLEGIFSEKNEAYREGPSRIWVAYENGNPVGRIAAFIDVKRNEQQELQVGGLGYFESVRSSEVANALLGAAEDWLREQGMQAVDGPVNFGERDKFWGLLVRGWYRPLYQESYNPPYYRAYFEGRGYQAYEQSLTLRGRLDEVPAERLERLGTNIKKRYGLSTKRITKQNLRQSADDFAAAYNASFSHNPYFKPLTGEMVYPSFQQMKPIMDTYLTCLVYDKEDKPVALAAFIPDINGFMHGFRGKLNWQTLPRFLWRLKFQKQRNFKGVALGVAEEYQKRGLYAVMCHELYKDGDRHVMKTYEAMDLATIRGHNDLMIASCRAIGTDIHRIHLAYRKSLVEGVDWEPFKMQPEEEVAMGDVSFWKD